MRTVITYGTFDLLHHGHVRLLERAKQLGDRLIVGVTSDQYDRSRGKLNVSQSTLERVDSVRGTGIADLVIIEEYEGQKIDDIRRYGVDVFTVGSDWEGHFDYLKDYCEVVYLERTRGISSTDIRSTSRRMRVGLVGNGPYPLKILKESAFVDGVEVTAWCVDDTGFIEDGSVLPEIVTTSYRELLDSVDAVFLVSHPSLHFLQAREALESGVNVLCESPLVLDPTQMDELTSIADSRGLHVVETLRTLHSPAYHHLLLLVESGTIGKVVSVDATCTSIRFDDVTDVQSWNSLSTWGPTTLLPIFQILGADYKTKLIVSDIADRTTMYDNFTRAFFVYQGAVATATVGKGVKSEGDLVVSGTEGYIYVPAPWWKTDYFEIRYEDATRNRRCFYQLEGEGIRSELASFARTVNGEMIETPLSGDISRAIASVFSDYFDGVDVMPLS